MCFVCLDITDDFLHFDREGIYVRVSGFMKSFGNKKYINASYMRPIVDSTEIFYHLAECIAAFLMVQRGSVCILSIIEML